MADSKTSEEEAREYAESIINTIHEPLMVLNQELRVISASRSFYEVFKVKPEETVGRLIYELGNKQWDIPELRQLLENILPRKTTLEDYEVEHEFADLGRRTMLLNAREIQRKSGKERLILLAIEDITERKRQENLVSASEERHRRLFETANDGILLLERTEGKITHANPAIKEMLDYRPDELIGKRLTDIGFPEDIGTIQEIFQTLEKDGVLHYKDASVQTKTGQVVDTDIYMVDKASLVQCNIRNITEHKQAEEGLRESEERYRLLVEASSDIVWTFDLSSMRYTYCSKSVETILGYSQEEVNGAKLDDIYPPETKKKVLAAFDQVFRGESNSDQVFMEAEHRHKDGSLVWLENNTIMHRDNQGQPVSFTGVSRDITKRKQMEEELTRNTELLRSTIESTDDGILVVDNNGKVLTTNDKFSQLWQIPKDMIATGEDEKLLNHVLDQLADPEHFINKVKELYSEPNAESFDTLYFKDGRIFERYSKPLLIRGSAKGRVWSFRDVTERKKAEEALRRSETQYRRLYESIRDAILVADTERNIIDCNQAFTETFGYSLQEIKGMKTHALYQNYEEYLKMGEEIRKNIGSTKFVYTINFKKKSGEIFPGETNTFYLTNNNNEILGFIGLIRDITERKQAEEALRRSENYYRAIFETSGTAMFIIEEDTTISHINSNFAELAGYSKQEVEGKKSWTEFIHPDDVGWMKEYHYLRRQNPDAAPRQYEFRFINRHGEERNMLLAVDMISGTNRSIASCIDITERKRMEEALCRERDLNQRYLDTTQTMMVALDAEGRVAMINRSGRELLGYAEDEILGCNWFETCLPQPEAMDSVYPVFRRIMAGDLASTEYFENRVVCRDGTQRLIGWHNAFLEDDERRIVGLLGSGEDITERKCMEEALRKSEEKFRLLFEKAGEGILIARGETIEFANPALEDILEYPIDKITSESFVTFIHPDDRETIRDLHLRMMQGEFLEKRYDFRIVASDGTVKWVSIHAQVIEWEGAPANLSFVIDITERKRAEEALRLSENYYRAIFETSATAMFILEQDTTISHVNSNFEKLLGYSKQEVEGKKSWTEFIHPDDVGWMKEYHYLRRRDPRAAPLNYEFRFFVRNDELRHGYLTVDIIPSTSQSVASFIDITERKQAEQQLRASEEKYRMLVENLNEVIYTLDENGRITYVSPSVESVGGYTPAELLGKQFIDFVHPDDKEARLEQFLKILSGIDEPSEYSFLTKNNQVVWIRTTARPLLKEGQVTGVQGVLVDITERKQAEQERDRLQAQLRQSQKMEAIGTLAGGIAHDFNNILSSVLGYTELSLDEIEKGSLVHQNLSQVLTAGNRAKGLVKQILAFGRKEEQEFTPTPIVPLVKEILKMLRSTFPTSIEIRENISIEQGVVYTAPTQLHQVIVNLATNAKQAMSDEGGILEVSVETVSFDENIGKKYPDMAPGSYARISVSDTGCGISEQYLDRIFEPYFTTSETGTGTGLGLSVVHGIVKAHKGHINVSSEPGEGTTFHVYLPLAEQERSRAASTVREGEALPTGTESVLIVDDEKPVVEILQQILESQGYRVTPQTSSVEALEAFQANPDKFDIVIMDMTMPNMTGDKLALKIKEIRPDVPVILCTGFSEKIDDQKKGELGIEGYMLKPVTKTDLAETVRKILDRSEKD